MNNETEDNQPSETAEALLLRSLAQRLSTDEKARRDHEVTEQAKKYFGGLTARERVLLGLGDTGAPREEVPVHAEPRAGLRNEWVWAVLSVAAFLGVLYWVIGAK